MHEDIILISAYVVIDTVLYLAIISLPVLVQRAFPLKVLSINVLGVPLMEFAGLVADNWRTPYIYTLI